MKRDEQKVDDALTNQFNRIIKTNKLLCADEPALVSLSGGPDSVCLLHLFARYVLRFTYRRGPCPLTALHINYGLRGAESDADEQFCRDLCGRLTIPIIVRRVNIPKNRIQTAARDARIAIYHELGISSVFLAHHHDDCLETVIFNLLRGSGSQGLQGMNQRSVRPDGLTFIRPLLAFRKPQILDWLARRNIAYRLDRSNLESVYSRNRIRNQVLPYLYKSIGEKKTVAAFDGLMAIARDREHLLDELFEKTGLVACLDTETIPLDRLKQACPAAGDFLNRYFQRQNITVSRRKIDLLLNVIDQGCGEVSLNKQYRMVAENNKLTLAGYAPPKSRDTDVLPLGIGSVVTLPDRGRIRLNRCTTRPGKIVNRNLAYIDREKIRGDLFVRSWRPGDRFAPLGMAGRIKKLQDYFTDEKIPRRQRDRIPLVCDNEKIVWVAGLRLDERVKIDDNTGSIMLLEWQPEQPCCMNLRTR